MLKLDTATLMKLLRLGARIQKLLGKPSARGANKASAATDLPLE
jgi:hypothetical protein